MADIVIADPSAVVITPSEAANIIEGQEKHIENLVDARIELIEEKHDILDDQEKTESEILTWQRETTNQLTTMQTALESLSASVAALLILPLLQTPNPLNGDVVVLENLEVMETEAEAETETEAEAEAEAVAPSEVEEQAPILERKYQRI